MYSTERDEVGRREPKSDLILRRTQCCTLTRVRASRERHDKEDNRGRWSRASAIGGYPSNNLDINQLWRAHCRPRTMDIVLFERSTKRQRARTLGVRAVFSQRAISGPGSPCMHTHTYIHTRIYMRARALSAVRLLLKARCPRGIIHCERGASRKHNVGITTGGRSERRMEKRWLW